MPFVSDYDDSNYQSGVNAQDSLVENITDKPPTDKETRNKIISSKISRFAEGFKIPNDKKEIKKPKKISRHN